jgi:hypothetical protein
LVGAVLSVGIFYGCQKKEFDLQNNQGQQSQTGSLQIQNAVTIDEAKQAYDEYLKQKPKEIGKLNDRGNNDSESQVVWESAQSFTFSDTLGNLIAASTDVYIKGEYKRAFFVRIRDTVRLLQVYVHPTDEYMKRNKGDVKMSNFDGLVGYKDNHDVLIGGYKVKNGKIERILIPKSDKPSNLGRDDPAFPNLMDEVTVTDTRPTNLWNGYFALSPVSSISSFGSFGSSGSSSSSNGGGSTNGSSTGSNSGSDAYSEIVIPSYLFQSQDPQVFLSGMGIRPATITYLTVKNRRLGTQVGEAIEVLGSQNSMETIEAFTDLIKSNPAFRAANIASMYDVNAILAFDKYRKGGFSGVEFAMLWLDQPFFNKAEDFVNRSGGDNLSFEIVKIISEDAEFKALIVTWPTIPPFLWDIIGDIGLEIVEKVMKKLNPASEITQDVIDVIKAYRGSDWFDFARKMGELGFDIAKTSTSGTVQLAFKVLDGANEARTLIKKIKPLVEPLQQIYDKVDAATFGKIYSAMSKMTNKNVLDKFQFFNESGNKNLKYFGSMKDFFNKIKDEFGASTYSDNFGQGGLAFRAGNIYFNFYPDATFNNQPTLEILVGGIRNANGSHPSGASTIIKIRQ